jgi:hypothetical protein
LPEEFLEQLMELELVQDLMPQAELLQTEAIFMFLIVEATQFARLI